MDKNTTSALYRILDNSSNIDEFMNEYDFELKTSSFEEYINILAKEKNCSIPEIISRGYMKESYCYQLFKGIRKPSRDKIIQLCFGMKLTLQESNKLLRAGEKNELYCRNKRDAVIIFGLNNNLAIIDVEEVLCNRGLETLLNIE